MSDGDREDSDQHNFFQNHAEVCMPVDIISAVYAGLVAAGGIIGYVKAGSIPSLVAGVLAGGVAGFGAWTSNFPLIMGVGVLLVTLMGIRFANSQKFMPAGLIAILSIIIVIRCVVYFVKKV